MATRSDVIIASLLFAGDRRSAQEGAVPPWWWGCGLYHAGLSSRTEVRHYSDVRILLINKNFCGLIWKNGPTAKKKKKNHVAFPSPIPNQLASPLTVWRTSGQVGLSLELSQGWVQRLAYPVDCSSFKKIFFVMVVAEHWSDKQTKSLFGTH